MIGETISHYKILEKLGGGGMGVVYKAQDTKLKRTVALKFLPPDLTRDEEAKTRFVHEAQAASALQHPNICTIHDIDETADGQLFIVMDYYEGETLKKRIERGPLKIVEAIDIVVLVAQGLEEAHKHQIIHRDVKPANVLITNNGVAKIVDFGLAKLVGRTVLTKSGSTVGTAAYMSPEQARGQKADARTDIWSLGVVLYEMLAGKRPFESEYEQALVYSIINQDPKPMQDLRPDVPEGLEKICQRAMAKDATDRYQSAAELISDLESYKAGTELSPKTRKVIEKKRKLLYAGLAATIFTAAFVGIFYFAGRGKVFDRVAVLPFDNISKDTTGEIMAYGMMADLIARLQQVASLKVPESRTMMRFKGSQLSHAEIARECKAKALVDGSIQFVNNRLHIIVKLIDPIAERILWSETYDDNGNDILSLQSKIAQAVVREVRVNVSPEVQGRLSRAEKRVNPQAYDLYLRARRDINLLFVSGPSKSAFDQIMSKLQKAIELEPDNAAYYSGVALAYSAANDLGLGSPGGDLSKLKAAAETALRLDSYLAESHSAMAIAERGQGNADKALAHSDRALELSPGSYEVNRWRAIFLTGIGRFEEAREIDTHLHELDPVAFRESGWTVGQDLYFMRQYDEAISFLRDWLRGGPAVAVGARWILAASYSMKGMHDQALVQCDSMGTLRAVNRPILLAKAGRRKLALEEWAQLRSKGISPGSYDLAYVYAGLQEKDSAFKYLEAGCREGGIILYLLKVDPFLDNLRDDPRFKELSKKMNSPY